MVTWRYDIQTRHLGHIRGRRAPDHQCLFCLCQHRRVLEETELEKQVSSLLEKQAGRRPDKIDCPGDLTAKEGTTMRCTLAAGGDELGITVTVTEVKGTTVNFNLEVDEKLTGLRRRLQVRPQPLLNRRRPRRRH